MNNRKKIFNDPVYGFVSVPYGLLLDLIDHPFFQRLRRIRQLGLAPYVYPGALHTRFHHALGALHLMQEAIEVLRSKGADISDAEAEAVNAAILLHDIGHGPFSHALEHTLVEAHHEEISVLFMEELNRRFDGRLALAIEIFQNRYPKKFLHQLVSGQLDADRMDYLNRDSFFTGVAEGVIGYDRIIKMLTVHNGQLMVEEKAIYSIEKFLVSRRLMYWQVYLHKTVVSAESMLVRIIRRAKELLTKGEIVTAVSAELDYFLKEVQPDLTQQENLQRFCRLDDHDIMATIKQWCRHKDKILSTLCQYLVERKLLKVKLQADPIDPQQVKAKTDEVMQQLGITEAEAAYFVFTGEACNTTYNPGDERINILFKDGTIKDISKVDNALIQQTLSDTVKKHYICYVRLTS